MRILILHGDAAAADLLRRRLWRDGHLVDIVPDGRTGLERAQSHRYDAVILDQTLPDFDGAMVVQCLRAAGIASAVLMLTGDTLADRLHGLDAGADDCLSKPFAFVELSARLRAITRRVVEPVQDDLLVVGDLVLDRRMRSVTRSGRALNLAPREFAVLEYLMRHPGQVITRSSLLEHVWDYGLDPRANVVDASIRRLRKGVDAGDVRPLIHTVRGVGYKIQAES